MKSLTPVVLFLFGALSLTLSSCLKDKCESIYTYNVYTPIYIKVDELRKDIQIEGPRTLKRSGKIYTYGSYLFINEYKEGIHIYDNSQPENPQNIGFIKIPGNVDIAVKDNLLYADNYIDLVTIDIQNPATPVFVSRTEEVFPSYGLFQDLGYLVDFQPSNQTVQLGCEDIQWQDGEWGFIRRETTDVVFDSGGPLVVNSSDNGASGTTGTGGSLARFTLAQGNLYVVDEYNLNVFSLENAIQPAKVNTVNIGWGIETIFPYGDKLFIGSSEGMYIYDNSNPEAPFQLSVFQHARACDPVFVDGNLAYVTLRNGTTCQNFTNQLDVIDITNLTNPVLLKSYQMHNPHGLSVVDNTLLLCEGDQGLKLFDTTDWSQIGNRQLAHITGFNTFDVIAFDNPRLAIVVGEDGLYQYDYSDPTQPKQLSVIPVTQ